MLLPDVAIKRFQAAAICAKCQSTVYSCAGAEVQAEIQNQVKIIIEIENTSNICAQCLSGSTSINCKFTNATGITYHFCSIITTHDFPYNQIMKIRTPKKFVTLNQYLLNLC